MKQPGKLVVVGTPVGNLQDASPRMVEALKNADVVAAEDTRRALGLLGHLGLGDKHVVSCHKDNEGFRKDELVTEMRAGKTVALISDSGMPCISDPGAVVVAAARAAGIPVSVVGGPCAATITMAGSGLEGAYVMAGFLPRKGKERSDALARLGRYVEHVVVYESANRLLETCEELLGLWGNRRATVGRELTKLHEEWIGPDLKGIIADLKARPDLRGECVLAVEGADASGFAQQETAVVGGTEILKWLAEGRSAKDIAAHVAEASGMGKREAYAWVVELKEKQNR